MLQIIIQGRGGQGAQTAGNLLAAAWFAAGWQVQCFASYGGARRGTPVSSTLRVDQRPVRLRCDVERADAILCFDASLLAGPLSRTADERTLVFVNSSRPAAHFADDLPGRRVLPLDALAIARRHGLDRIVNSALIGGFARALAGAGAPGLDVLEACLGDAGKGRTAQNIAACRDGWRAIDAALQPEVRE
ncbi:2-oxoacid:acceptor oxidoreductase family protein [Aquabacterium humicola]|uniref:2-oxoacid:acceptor oxidoreductase family protein n=1 Tax=Aquabacterium humicola TaxID=3237377 RepID=UPI002543F72F|nr:2-oxoacid:acceptor oxidoreductase family protein [Rubrivivax pictus]